LASTSDRKAGLLEKDYGSDKSDTTVF